jgi:DNA-binding HxlR family transcriptional regulator
VSPIASNSLAGYIDGVATEAEAKTPPEGAPTGDVMRAKGLAREVFHQLVDRWSLLVIGALGKEPKLRFCQLRDQIEGVSQKMLTQTLRQLERDGLVSRQVYPVVPPRVEYRLTPLGTGLLSTVRGICSWAARRPLRTVVACPPAHCAPNPSRRRP